MTVKQLIAALKKMPQNATVYRIDYEHGYCYVADPRDIAKLTPSDRPAEYVATESGGYKRMALKKGVIL